MKDHSIQHGTFTISRTVQAPVADVYRLFADKASKELWFKGQGIAPDEHVMDFREGGEETSTGTFPDGTAYRFHAYYFEILPEDRIIYTYELLLDDKRTSVSTATIEFQAVGDTATQLTISEAGQFLDGLDTPQERQQGSMRLIDSMQHVLGV